MICADISLVFHISDKSFPVGVLRVVIIHCQRFGSTPSGFSHFDRSRSNAKEILIVDTSKTQTAKWSVVSFSQMMRT